MKLIAVAAALLASIAMGSAGVGIQSASAHTFFSPCLSKVATPNALVVGSIDGMTLHVPLSRRTVCNDQTCLCFCQSPQQFCSSCKASDGVHQCGAQCSCNGGCNFNSDCGTTPTGGNGTKCFLG